MEEYLREHHTDEITDLMNESIDDAHYSIFISLQHLQQSKFPLFLAILQKTHTECLKWDAVLLDIQKRIVENGDAFLDDNYTIKVNCHVRFVNLPPPDPRYKLPFPNNDQIGKFVQLKVNVVRITQQKLFEQKREYCCSKCHETILVEAKYERMYVFDPPRSCANAPTCKGQMHQKNLKPKAEYCLDFQEIKVQELVNEKNIPSSLVVTLDNDLVDSCQPGECVTLCGTIERRWKPLIYGRQAVLSIAMRAVSLTRDKKRVMISEKYQPENLLCMQAEWADSVQRLGELAVRDTIVESICPEIRGMYVVKLAIALVICSGGIENTVETSSGCNIRGQSHLLLVGDPGLAKSKLLMSAASFAPRSVHTTGMGSSAAGLTAAAIQENGEWQLEAGALVLADGGICCIDEFNLMRETDRASIHEAMEQQTVSLAKAGMVCKLRTRCAVLAATNPRNLYSMCEPEGASALNVGIASPLMSRFDLVYILRDERVPEWDDQIATHLLELAKGVQVTRLTATPLWNTEKLQSHFAAIRLIHPRMTEDANKIIGEYYKKCRADPCRDNARSTVRLLDSLIRLAQAHARLLFRNEVTAEDAVIVIRLMESTHGFGRVLKPFDVIKEELPLGPSRELVEEIYSGLGLGTYEPQQRSDTVERPITDNTLVAAPNAPQNVPQNASQNESQNATINSPQNASQRASQNASQRQNSPQNAHQRASQNRPQNASENALQNASQRASQRQNSPQNASQSVSPNVTQNRPQNASQTVVSQDAANIAAMYDENLSEDELDRILTLDIPPLPFSMEPPQTAGPPTLRTNAKTTTTSAMEGEEFDDEILSQALDDAHDTIVNQLSHQPPTSPVQTMAQPIPKLKFKFQRSRMSLNRNLASTSVNKENIIVQLPTRNPSEDIFSECAPQVEPRGEKSIGKPVKIKRNRLLECDDSDEDEIEPIKKPTRILTPPWNPKPSTSKVSPQTVNKLNAFVNPKLRQKLATEIPVEVRPIQTAPENVSKSKRVEDSAYGTQESANPWRNSTQTNSSQQFEFPNLYEYGSDEDLSCLDSLDLPQK